MGLTLTKYIVQSRRKLCVLKGFGIMTSRRRKKIVGYLFDQVDDQVIGQVIDRAWDQIWFQVRRQVWFRVRGQVMDQILNQVREEIDENS
jgi:hypothetical protein